MNLAQPRTVAEVLDSHVKLEVESIDRMYLNVCVPLLQREGGVAAFFRNHSGKPFVSSALMDPISKAFVAAIHRFVKRQRVELVSFKKGQRKDDVTRERLAKFPEKEGVLYVGRAQEKASVFRTEKRTNPQTGYTYPWLVRSTAMVNQFYFYCLDKDFGPFFLKFNTYFPYNAKLCINGHEYAKCQLGKEGIGFEALDNGILTCANPKRLQQLCDELSAEKIDALLRKWLHRLPHPYTAADRAAGYRYELSMLQAEFSLTQVLDRPVSGRILFEELIRENLDIGRPSQVQLIFDRRVTRRTPGQFRTRVITEGVTPSLHIDYKKSRIKQYHKEGRALRTETTINDTYDFGIGRRIKNLPELRKVGFAANRRLLKVEKLSHDCALGNDAFGRLQAPVVVNDQRAAGLRYADPRVQALLSAICLFCLLPNGFTNADLRRMLAPLLGLAPGELTQGRMTYDLRRLRLHGIIERIPKTHRYRVTDDGLRAALFFTRTYARILRKGLSVVLNSARPNGAPIRRAFDQLTEVVNAYCDDAKIAA